MHDTQLDQIIAAVERGELTPEAARTFAVQSIHDAHATAAVLTRAAAPGATPWGQITETGLSPAQLAVRSLMATGVSEVDALRQVAEKGPESYTDAIAAEAEKVLTMKNKAAEAKWLTTAEGRRHTAEQAELAAQQRARTLQLAKTLLTEDMGLSEADVAALSDAEILTASGIEGREDTFRIGADDLTINRQAAGLDRPVEGSENA